MMNKVLVEFTVMDKLSLSLYIDFLQLQRLKKEFISKVYIKKVFQSKLYFPNDLLLSSLTEEKKLINRRVIDNKPSAVISKEELVRYFQEPDSDLGLIDLETQQLRSDMDWISNSVLKQNADTITEFNQYEDDNLSPIKNTDESSLPHSLRLRAKHDAIAIISEWKNESRLNQ